MNSTKFFKRRLSNPFHNVTSNQRWGLLLPALTLAGCENFNPAPVEFGIEDIVPVGDVRTLEISDVVVSSLPLSPPEVDPQRKELGRLLFWDPVLSGNQDVACATCHLPESAYTDGRERSIGVSGVGRGPDRMAGDIGPVVRNSQSLVNVAWNGITELGMFNPDEAPMFWDNRVMSLKAQAEEPLRSREEMRGDNFTEEEILPELLQRLQGIPEYVTRFNETYGENDITRDMLTDALATFQTSLVANNSRFDQWMRGDNNAMSSREVSGLQEFVRAGCAACHSGPMFADFAPHILGSPEGAELVEPDQGDGQFGFRTPSLRQLAMTAPYFHAGQFQTLADVIEFYDEPERSSNSAVPRSELDADFVALPEMDGGRESIIRAFLETLNDPEFDRVVPSQVPSGLTPGGSL